MKTTIAHDRPTDARPRHPLRIVAALAAAIALAAMASQARAPLSQAQEPQPPKKEAAQESAPAAEKDASPVTARLVRVPLPLTNTAAERLRRQVGQIVESLPASAQRPLLIFEFSSETGEGRSGEFETVLRLARHLSGPDLARVRTVAFLPKSVKGHAVLAVLACEEIIMAPDAELGEAGLGEAEIDPIMRSGYAEIAKRRFMPVAVALGMLDPKLHVHRAETGDGVRYVLNDELEELSKQGALKSQTTLIPEGQMGLFTGRQMRLELGFATLLAADRRELATALKIPGGSLEDDPSLGDGWRPVRFVLQGPIKGHRLNQVRRSLADRLDAGGNFALVEIDSRGGDLAGSLVMAQSLAGYDPEKVRTVAYVPNEARADSALAALACQHVILGEQAVLGGPSKPLDPERRKDVHEAIKALAKEAGRDWSLLAAMVDPDLTVYRCVHVQTSEVRYFSADEIVEQPEPAAWRREEPLDTKGGFTALRALELGLARDTVANVDELKQLYGLEADMDVVQPNWAHQFVETLANPWLAGLLLWVAFFMLMTEATTPGIGVPGFISAVCFTLYFWSQFLHGTAGWLEVMLFGLGLLCVILEVAVLPGIGVFGIGGGLLIIASILLATQTFVFPTTVAEWETLPKSLAMVAAAGLGMLLSAVVMSRILPEAPVFNRMMLRPPEGEQAEELSRRESLVNWAHLAGKRGTTITKLVPAGKARFGDELVDVISDGELIESGVPVFVLDVAGNRVLVSRANS